MSNWKSMYATALVLTILVVVMVNCSGSAPTPTPAPAPPTTAPSAPTTAPAKPAATQAAATQQSSTQPIAAAATKPAVSVTVADLIAKAKSNREYSAELKASASGVAIMTAKYFSKGAKVRVEMSVMGLEVLSLVDLDAKTVLSWNVGDKQATKAPVGEIIKQLMVPSETVIALPSDAKVTSTETVDGKPAALVEVASTAEKYWIWTEKGLPLKGEVITNARKGELTFVNYKFEAQPDSLFQQPPDLKIQDAGGTAAR